jgi:hypothetical protein
MLKRADRERKVAEWLEHLQAWKDSGLSLARYAREHEITAFAAYHWRARLIKRGLWRAEPSPTQSGVQTPDDSLRVPLRFARVRVAPETRSRELVVRVQLANGRALAIEIGEADQLVEVLSALERGA